MKTIKITLVAFLALLASSCNFDFNIGQITGNGNVVTEERNVESDFTGVSGAAGIDVFLTKGTENKILVEADDNLLEIIETSVVNGQLRIKAVQNIGRAKAKKVHVTYTQLDNISASSGADVIGKSTIKSEYLTLESSSGADLDVNVHSKEIFASSSSGADLKITGITRKLNADASSGADIKAKDLEAKICTASASSGADIVVNASEEIDGRASSGGDIVYYGNPTAVSVKDGSSGSVRKM